MNFNQQMLMKWLKPTKKLQRSWFWDSLEYSNVQENKEMLFFPSLFGYLIL